MERSVFVAHRSDGLRIDAVRRLVAEQFSILDGHYRSLLNRRLRHRCKTALEIAPAQARNCHAATTRRRGQIRICLENETNGVSARRQRPRPVRVFRRSPKHRSVLGLLFLCWLFDRRRLPSARRLGGSLCRRHVLCVAPPALDYASLSCTQRLRAGLICCTPTTLNVAIVTARPPS